MQVTASNCKVTHERFESRLTLDEICNRQVLKTLALTLHKSEDKAQFLPAMSRTKEFCAIRSVSQSAIAFIKEETEIKFFAHFLAPGSR